MLSISAKQLDALKQHCQRAYVEEVMRQLCVSFPKKTGTLEMRVLRTQVEEGIIVAAQYGITDRNDVRRFLDFHVQYDARFGETAESAWASTYLQNPNLNGTEKMDQIDDHYLFEVQMSPP